MSAFRISIATAPTAAPIIRGRRGGRIRRAPQQEVDDQEVEGERQEDPDDTEPDPSGVDRADRVEDRPRVADENRRRDERTGTIIEPISTSHASSRARALKKDADRGHPVDQVQRVARRRHAARPGVQEEEESDDRGRPAHGLQPLGVQPIVAEQSRNASVIALGQPLRELVRTDDGDDPVGERDQREHRQEQVVGGARGEQGRPRVREPEVGTRAARAPSTPRPPSRRAPGACREAPSAEGRSPRPGSEVGRPRSSTLPPHSSTSDGRIVTPCCARSLLGRQRRLQLLQDLVDREAVRFHARRIVDERLQEPPTMSFIG